MTPEFEEALGLWECGGLSRDELVRRFPDEDVAGVLEAFERMSAAPTVAAPDASAAWAALRTRLPVRLTDRRRGRGKAIRLLAAALIAVLVLGASAYAVVPSVRKAVNDAAGAISGDPTRSTDPTRPGGTADPADAPTPDVTTDDDSAADPDEVTAGHEPDTDEQDADDDSTAGSDSGSDDEADEGNSGSGTDDGSGPDEGSLDGGSGSGGGGDGNAAEDDGSGSETSEG